MLISRLPGPSLGARLCVGEAVAKPQATVSLLHLRTKRQKRTKVLPKPWPLDHALRKVEERCAIHNANVTVALLLQTPVEMKRKRAAHLQHGVARRP
jgi:hypothetical protein